MTASTEVPVTEKMTSIPDHIREVFSKATCLYPKDQIESALEHMAIEMSYELSHANPIFLCVVVGGMIPMGNLLPRLAFPLEVDYVHATRYRGGMVGKDLHWIVKPVCDMKGRRVVVVDDILDGGLTLAAVANYCKEQGAEKVYTAALVEKIRDREADGIQEVDFAGLKVEDHYVFGYGMDYKGYLRNAPGIYVVAPEHE